MVMVIIWNEDLHLLLLFLLSLPLLVKLTEDKEDKDYPEIYRGGGNYH